MIRKKDLLRRIEELEKKNKNLVESLDYHKTDNHQVIRELQIQLVDIKEKNKRIIIHLEHLLEKQTEKELVSLIDKFGAILDKFFSKSEKNSKKCKNEQKRGRGRPLGSKNKNKKEGK